MNELAVEHSRNDAWNSDTDTFRRGGKMARSPETAYRSPAQHRTERRSDKRGTRQMNGTITKYRKTDRRILIVLQIADALRKALEFRWPCCPAAIP
jgi:hypothetical protein